MHKMLKANLDKRKLYCFLFYLFYFVRRLNKSTNTEREKFSESFYDLLDSMLSILFYGSFSSLMKMKI